MTRRQWVGSGLRWALAWTALSGAAAFGTVACGGGSGSGTATPASGGSGAAAPASASGPRYRFAIIPKSLDIPVFNYAKIGAEREAKAIGNVEIIWRAPETADQLRQKEILESFITQRVDGIAISCTN